MIDIYPEKEIPDNLKQLAEQVIDRDRDRLVWAIVHAYPTQHNWMEDEIASHVVSYLLLHARDGTAWEAKVPTSFRKARFVVEAK